MKGFKNHEGADARSSPINRGSEKLILLFIAFSLAPVLFAFAQSDIPIGTWRTHLSYNNISSVALGNQKVFAAGNHGLMILDQQDNSLRGYSKIDGLTGTTITGIAYDVQNGLLIVSYLDGRFDVINAAIEVSAFDPAKHSTIIGSKKINNISLHGSLAYLSTDYGVVVFDLTRMLVKETWRDLGKTGETLKIFQSTVNGDSIILATEFGAMMGSLNDNLLDFNNWKRFESGDFSGPVQSVCTFDNKVFAALNTLGIYHYQNGAWIKNSFLQGATFRSMYASSDNLLITESNIVYKLSADDILSPITDELIVEPNFALEDSGGKLWIGDRRNGLVTNVTGAFVSNFPNCPSSDQVFNLVYHDMAIYALPGGYSLSRDALGNEGRLDLFLNGSWSDENSAVLDLTDITFGKSAGYVYRASFGYGIEVRDPQGTISVFDDSNSPLINSNPPGHFVNITSLYSSATSTWVANYGASQSLHLLREDNSWESFSFSPAVSKYPLHLIEDFYGNVWMALDPLQGGGIMVFNKEKNSSVYLNDVVGSGGLPSTSVNALALDRDGIVWVGTDVGVAYFNDPTSVFSGKVDAIKPIFDSRFLLKDDNVTSIAVDGGNRKWMGTERGVWHFNETGEELINNFNTLNSPLLSDVIQDIEINGESGEVFFATAEGLLSFRSDATESKPDFQSVKVFPNPVTANFVGEVGITGLTTDAFLKITDIRGKLIWQTRANGGAASWNVQDINGKRPPTGVYILFAVREDGKESVVAKIAVVE